MVQSEIPETSMQQDGAIPPLPSGTRSQIASQPTLHEVVNSKGVDFYSHCISASSLAHKVPF